LFNNNKRVSNQEISQKIKTKKPVPKMFFEIEPEVRPKPYFIKMRGGDAPLLSFPPNTYIHTYIAALEMAKGQRHKI